MKTRVRAALLIATFGVAAYWNVRETREWVREKPAPLSVWLDEVDAAIPSDARVVLDAPADGLSSDHYRVHARLHPRAVYALPAGVKSLEAARPWIAGKKATWVVSIGPFWFDGSKAYARKLDDRR